MVDGNIHTPYTVYDPRINKYRALGMYYNDITHFLRRNEIRFLDNVQDYINNYNFENNSNNPIKLRDYQKEALTRWITNNRKGCIILPTGAGKTLIAIHAITITNVSTLVVVPTINLMDQWYDSIKRNFIDKDMIGRLGGGIDDVKMITITTYDSAFLKSSFLGNKFKFLIFDEVHHLGADKYFSIGEQFISPYRLGLTATIERDDSKHLDIFKSVGKIIYKKDFTELAENRHLSKFKTEKISIDMLPAEISQYNKKMSEYSRLLKESRIFYPISLEKLVILSGNNPNLRKALLLRNEALEIALNSKAKITEIEKMLNKYTKEKIIVFTIHTKLAYTISNRFLIPVITHKTKNEERNEILEGFKNNKYRVIVTTKVLDEGTDVPDANVGIIVSGTGSKREFIQRLGRLLRPKTNNENFAELVEIISSNTSEVYRSNRRNKAIKANTQQ